MNIKRWYLKAYPDDEIGLELSHNATFEELLQMLDSDQDVYEYLGVFDSLIRERVFSRLAELAGVPDSYIYELWSGDDESLTEGFIPDEKYRMATNSPVKGKPIPNDWLVAATHEKFIEFFGENGYSYFTFDLSNLTDKEIIYLKKKANRVIDRLNRQGNKEDQVGVKKFIKYLEKMGY